jgi:hypothetical protein
MLAHSMTVTKPVLSLTLAIECSPLMGFCFNNYIFHCKFNLQLRNIVIICCLLIYTSVEVCQKYFFTFYFELIDSVI